MFCKKGVLKNFSKFLEKNLCLCNFIKKETLTQAEAATGGVLWKKVFLKISQNSQENPCARVSFLIKNFKKLFNIKLYLKETLAQVFSCEFCEIFKNTFFTEHHWTTAPAQGFSFEFCEIFKKTFFIEHLRWLFLKLGNNRSNISYKN